MDRKWKLGELCYIADVHIARAEMRFRVMPARVLHVAGVSRTTATAYSANPPWRSLHARCEPFTQGCPFPDRWSAFIHVWREMRRNSISVFKSIRFEGTAPEMENLPADVPQLGQIVYGIDIEAQEVFEAQIGYLRYEYGRLEIGYDESPGNPEASNVRIQKWWSSREAAETYMLETYDMQLPFVSKEELATRTDARIDKIWSDALARVKSPEFQASIGALWITSTNVT